MAKKSATMILLLLIEISLGFHLPRSFSKLNPEVFEYWKLDVLVSDTPESDLEIDAIKNMIKEGNFYIRTSGSSFCDSRELRITFQTPVGFEKKKSFLKDPCESILVIDTDSMPEFYPNQPYFYWFNGKDIFEIQTFSKNSIKIASFENNNKVKYLSSDVYQRRSDFNGAAIITNYQDMKSFFHFGGNGEMLGVIGEALELFKDKFNFSIEWYDGKPENGIKQKDGSWNGYIGALISGDLDFNAVDLGFTPDRINVISPGFARSRHQISVVYKRISRTWPNLLAIFQIFSLQLWILIGATVVCCSAALYQFKEHNILECVFVVVKAYSAQAIDKAPQKTSHKMLAFTFSLCGAILYWSYSGTLVSNLASPVKEPPFKNTEEFLNRPGFQLHTLSESVYYSSFVNHPKKEILQKLIDPYTFKISETNAIINQIKNSNGDDVNIGYLEFVNEFKMSLNDDINYCNFEYQNIQDIPQMWVGWMYPYHSMIQPLFDRFTFEILQGIHKIQDHYSYINYDCQLQKDFHSVNYGFVAILFYVLITGATLSLIFLWLEKICSQ